MASNHSSIEFPINDFGPIEPGRFDFTPLFEDVFFSSVPSALLLLSLPVRIWMLKGQPRKVTGSFLHSNKMLFLGVFTIMQAALLIMNIATSTLRTRATIAAATLTLIDAIGLCALSHIEHLRSVRPSAIINAWLLLTLPLDIAHARTLWLDRLNNPTAAVFTSTLGIKIMILIAEAIEKRHILLDRYRHASPEATSGIYSRSFFWWLNTLMRDGFQRIIRNEDLYPIGEDMNSEYLYLRAQATWDACDQNGKRALFWATLKTARGALAYGILPRICMIALTYVQPFLLSRTVEFANDENQPESIGWGLTGAFGLVFLGMAVCSGAYYHMAYRFNTIVRGSLVTLIYSKTVDLSITALDESVAVTLMANDTDAICQGFTNIHELWAVPIELAIALFLLERQLGLAFLAPCSVAIICTAGVFVMAKSTGSAQKVWMRGIQTRVDVTASMLGSMKAAKMLGFTDIITNMVQSLRVSEVYLSTLYRRLICGRVFLANSTGVVSPLATFTVFVISAHYTGQTLTTSKAYTAMSLIALLANPMNTLMRTILMINTAIASFDRIQAFLKSDPRRDHRLPISAPTVQKPKLPSQATRETKQSSPEIELVALPSSRQKTEGSTPQMLIAQNATFAWSVSGPRIIHDFSYSLSCGEICFIIGPVGCGKSTLLKGLLGETPSSQGFVYTRTTTTAFVEQTPWIQNGTIRDNILGPGVLDVVWYERVVRACALEYDVNVLPDGSETRVGSGGISLSGGQKQRLALARAVYAKTPFIILDDFSSGLDAETEDQVFKRLLGRGNGGGLLREMGTTVLLVTHAVHRLDFADYVIALGKGEDGVCGIVEQGTTEELRRKEGYVWGLKARSKSDEVNEKAEENVPVDSLRSTPFPTPKNDPLTDELLDLNRQTGDLSVYKYYFNSIGLFPSLLFLVFVLVFGAAFKMPEFCLTYWTRAVAAKGNEANAYWLGIFAMLTGVSLLGFVAGICHLLLFMVPRSAEVLHRRLLGSVMGAPLSFFTGTDTGVTTNRFSQDMSIVDVDLPYALVDLVSAAVVAIMGAILMCLSASYFAATIPVVILVVWILQNFYLRTSRQIRLLDLEAKSPLYTHFLETLSGLPTIRAFGWTTQFHATHLNLLNTSQKPYYLLFCIQRWLGLVLDLLVTILALILMLLIVKLRNSLSPGYVGLALLNVMTFNQSLAEIIKNWTVLETAIGAISRLKTFSATTACENLPGEIGSVPASWPEFGEISFENVNAAYSAHASSVRVLQDLNLRIRPGEKVGICGRSGSGKSSLVAAIFRMLELVSDESVISIDGVDIAKISRQTVRARLNAIPQEPFFLRGSVRYNADPYGRHGDERIREVLGKVGLWDVVSEKGGLDVHMDGEFLSVGQKQLFCLARAILRKGTAEEESTLRGMTSNGMAGEGRAGNILIMDEATSSVDATTEKLMQRIIREEFEGHTIIAVAHRLEGIIDFDRVVVLREGRVVQVGRPGDLMGMEGGAFRELWNS